MSTPYPQRSAPTNGPSLWLLYPLFFAAVTLAHWTLLRLPYYWDEGGYYIPAALDFYRHGLIVPHFTNAHTPLPNVLLGTLWRIVGYHIIATRIFVCAVSAFGFLGVYRLARGVIGVSAAFATTLITAVYPIWFAQSSLAHADLFAAVFALWGFSFYFLNEDQSTRAESSANAHPKLYTALFFTIAVLSKETAFVESATLATIECVLLLCAWRSPINRRDHAEWLAALSFPLLPLIAWFAYHHHVTGFAFGNPGYLRYNATDNFTAEHIISSLQSRAMHLFWQRNIWLPITLAIAGVFLRPRAEFRQISPAVLRAIALLVLANWIAFSVLGGAPLTRYLLPVYPLILLVCIATWRNRTRLWPLFAALTAAAFISALWINPPVFFAPEDNLTYRDMIVVHQQAITFLSQNYPDATVLTAWPVTGDLFSPDLGYTTQRFRVVPVDDFTPAELRKATQQPVAFDTVLVITTHYVSPELHRYLESHPDSRRSNEFARTPVLTPVQIATLLHAHIVWQTARNGESATILRLSQPMPNK